MGIISQVVDILAKFLLWQVIFYSWSKSFKNFALFGEACGIMPSARRKDKNLL
jgi:hypothetical protein